ncbi:MAG: hypothetical protein H0X31_01055 [Nostocaceae cyanobacterium]|nr:hypothetical protein [Nostocaceae cyanobacterium]
MNSKVHCKRNFIFVVIFSFALFLQPIHAFQAPISPANPSSILEVLPPRLIANTIRLDINSGSIYFTFDNQKRLLFVLSGQDHFYLPFPSELDTIFAIQGDFHYQVDQPFFGLCLPEGLFIIDIPSKNFYLLSSKDCRHSNINFSPDGHIIALNDGEDFYDLTLHTSVSLDAVSKNGESWVPYWSPHWDYRLQNHVVDNPTVECHKGISSEPVQAVLSLIDSASIQTTILCTNWDEFIPIRWIDDHHALVKGIWRTDAKPKEEELFEINTSTKEAKSLGIYIHDSLHLVDSFRQIIGVNVQEYPRQCHISLINLVDMKRSDIEKTYCQQPADIQVLDRYKRVIYLQSTIPPEGSEALAPQPHTLDLSTHYVTPIELNNVNEISGYSKDERFLAFIQDTSASVSRNIFHQDAYQNPNLSILDVDTNQVVYRANKLTRFPQIVWSPFYSAVIISSQESLGKGMRIISLIEKPVEIILPDTIQDEYEWRGNDTSILSSVWSPDGKYVLSFTEYGLFVTDITVPDKQNSVIQFFQDDLSHIAANWDFQNHLIVEVLPQKVEDTSITLQRWLVDPNTLSSSN